ncbi:uncharacterized protein EV154DRAFT_256426 [Mucor mucedo]|uniref:uncharacterized protein n=1 Tax=Mucor mucedo TaxID=29922 RepID=UPI00221F57EF|nr:uncharacterized protein EV154DRAFT_256426 [Mucor mucedo]KAI7890149.1 hypothetical protein EV154DRAFT_256426 [Mucor mucedo]
MKYKDEQIGLFIDLIAAGSDVKSACNSTGIRLHSGYNYRKKYREDPELGIPERKKRSPKGSRFKLKDRHAVSALQSAGKAVSVNAIAQQMTHFIVNNYNDMSFFVYKADWIKRIITTFQLTDTAFSGSKINFEKIFCYIDKALGIENNLLLEANDLVTMTNH